LTCRGIRSIIPIHYIILNVVSKKLRRETVTRGLQSVCGSFTTVYTNRNRFLHMSIFKVNGPVLHDKPIGNDFHYYTDILFIILYIIGFKTFCSMYILLSLSDNNNIFVNGYFCLCGFDDHLIIYRYLIYL